MRRAAVTGGEVLQHGKFGNLFGQAAATDGAVRKKRDLSSRALFGDPDRLSKVRIEPILYRLNLDDRARLIDLLDGDIAQTDMTALALPLQLSKRLDALFERNARIRRMKLIQPDLIDSERAEAPLARFADVLRRAVARPGDRRSGQRVRVVWKPTDGGPPVPTFTPA